MSSKIDDKALPIDSDEPEHEPDITKLAEFPREARSIRSFTLTGIFVLALFYTLYFARIFLLPIMLALLFAFLLRPAVRGLERLRIPEIVGAALVLLVLLGAVGYGISLVATPASDWIAKAPQNLRQIEDKLRTLREPINKVSKATEQAEKITSVNEGKKPQVVKVENNSFMDIFFNQTSEVLIGAGTTLILLYFLLASGDLFLRKMVKVLPTLQDKKRAVEIAHEIEGQISIYLLTVTMIFGGQGFVFGVAMFFMKMPNPLLWGVMSALLEFIPYLGPAVGIGVVSVVALLTFNSIGHAALAPLIYFGLTVIQSNLITPIILGRRLTLNPVVVFVGIVFWGWIWGIVGTFLAVPILMTFKILCDHIEPL
ncbi:MAG: AI-2E family transporter, partial [Ignavibacteriales bacterium]